MAQTNMCSSLQHISSIPGLNIEDNGSITRKFFDAPLPPRSRFDINGVASKDVVINLKTGVWARIFVPHHPSNDPPRLPVLLYFHPGGFVMGSAATPQFHEYCGKLATRCQVVVISVDYRLSPEHRLPAAFDDGFDVLKWLQTQATVGLADPWISSRANLCDCYILGHSSGGTMAHHVVLRAAEEVLSPIKLEGVILAEPFFGKNGRTTSEVEFGGEEALLSMKITDAMWALALPQGADRDHKFCNVMGDTDNIAAVASKLPRRFMVIVAGKDMLRDMQIEYVEALRNLGIKVRCLWMEDADHFTMYHEKHGVQEVDEICRFIYNYVKTCV